MNIFFAIPDPLGRRLKVHCQNQGVKQGKIICDALEAYLPATVADPTPDENEAGVMFDELTRMQWNQEWSEALAAEARERYPWLPIFQRTWVRSRAMIPKYSLDGRKPTLQERAERDENLRLAKLRWMMD